MNKLKLAAVAIAALFVACSEDDPMDDINNGADYSGLVLVLNEGQYGIGDAEVDVYSRSAGLGEREIFNLTNNAVLGDILQDAVKADGSIFLVLNNSNKVVKVDATTFVFEKEYNNLTLPSGVAVADGHLFVTEWLGFGVPGQISKIDISTGAKVDSVAVGELPGKPLVVESTNTIWVPNTSDTIISIVHYNSGNALLSQIIPTEDYPNSLALDGDNQVWALCSGAPSWTGTPTNASLVKFNIDGSVQNTIASFPHNDAFVKGLTIGGDGRTLAYVFGGIKIFDTQLESFQGTISNGSCYGVGVDPINGDYYMGVSPQFDQNGYVFRYSAAAELLDSIPSGVGPNGFIFN